MQHLSLITLLSKRLGGEITPEELDMLNEWLAQDIEHKRMADAYQFIWDRAAGVTFEEPLSPNLDLAFAKVMPQQAPKPATAPSVPFFKVSMGRLARVAASVVALAVALWGVLAIIATNQYQATIEVKAENMDKLKVDLPDGSVVWLRKGSTLRYPKAFGKDSRCVELNGEAFFEVIHNPQLPFCATTSRNERIEVLGTSFDIREADSTTSVMVKTGKVRFSAPNNAANTIVTAGHVAKFDRQASKITVSNAASFNEIAWQMGHLEFMDTSIEQVIKDFESYFGIKIQLDNTELLQCRYTSTHVPADVEKALEAFSSTFKFEITFSSSKSYILNGGSCL